jgi:hypothetical protein
MRHAPLAALSVLALLAAPAAADEGPVEAFVQRVRAESAIESRMVAGYVRGVLGPQPAPPDWTPRTHGKGRLERGPGGVPVLHLEGTPDEIGEQHGALLKTEIRALLRSYVTSFVGKRELPAAKAQAARLFAAHLTDDERREVAALARAADLPEEDVLFGQWFTDVYRAFACSTLAGPSAEGELLARNLDFPSMGYLGRYSIVSVVKPTGKKAFVSVGWPGLIGVLSGESHDVALSVMVVHNAEGARAGVPFQLAFRRVLEQAGSAAEAEAQLRATALTVTNNLMVVDRGGDARVLELHPDGIVARHPDANGRLVSTNHFVSPERRQARLSFEFISSLRRYRQVEDACPAGEGPLTIATARRALEAASVDIVTLQSMVFLPAAGALEVSLPGRPPSTKGTWVRIDVSADLP